jgi:hypothetical protein
VYVYAEGGQPHHQSHCHVKWAGHETSVSLVDLRVLAGSPLPIAARRLVEEHLEMLLAAWNLLNPRRTI